MRPLCKRIVGVGKTVPHTAKRCRCLAPVEGHSATHLPTREPELCAVVSLLGAILRDAKRGSELARRPRIGWQQRAVAQPVLTNRQREARRVVCIGTAATLATCREQEDVWQRSRRASGCTSDCTWCCGCGRWSHACFGCEAAQGRQHWRDRAVSHHLSVAATGASVTAVVGGTICFHANTTGSIGRNNIGTVYCCLSWSSMSNFDLFHSLFRQDLARS